MTLLIVGLPIGLSGSPGNPNPPLSSPEGQRKLFATAAVASPLAVVLGVAAIVGTLVYLFVIEGLVSALPHIRDYYMYLPGGALNGPVNNYQANVHYLSGWAAGLLLVAYGAAFAVLGTALAVRRDVT